jgi:erythromycin esterase-like protein
MNPEFKACEKDVLSILRQLLEKRLEYCAKELDGEEFHSAEQNARLVVDSEKNYRSMYYRDEKSWNLRDTHLFETLRRLLAFKKNAKAVDWAHNSHLGDARYTSMGKRNGEINLGQLCRQNFAGRCHYWLRNSYRDCCCCS